MVRRPILLSNHKLVFFGNLSVYSHAVLAELLRLGVKVAAVVLPGVGPMELSGKHIGRIPLMAAPPHPTVELLAIEYHVPIIYTQDIQSQQFALQLKQYAVPYYLVACFPFKLPPSICSLPTTACLNLHPSLLPAYRGPYPVFWQLQRNEANFGVSLHCVTEQWDAGDVIVQKSVALVDGMRGRAIDAKLGLHGARAFIEAIKLYHHGRATPHVQTADQASYFPKPEYPEFAIQTTWTARHAFNFMRGTEEWRQAYHLQVDDQALLLDIALAYSPTSILKQKTSLDDGVVMIQFAQGSMQAKLKQPLF